MMDFKDHELIPQKATSCEATSAKVDYQRRQILDKEGRPIPGLYSVWITLNNPAQYNSYTTQMVKVQCGQCVCYLICNFSDISDW